MDKYKSSRDNTIIAVFSKTNIFVRKKNLINI